MIPVRDIRAAGRDVRVARFAASERCDYAMFSGGGLTWFEERAKRGDYALAAAPAGARPDLAGLSCRWGVAPAKHGVVLSVIVAPRGDDERYPILVQDIVRMAIDGAEAGRPVTLDRLGVATPAQAIALEAHALKSTGASGVRATAQRRRGLRARRDLSHVQAEGRRLRRGRLCGRRRRQCRFPQVRRRAAHDARLHARLRRQDGGAPERLRTTSPSGASFARRPRKSPASSPRSPSGTTSTSSTGPRAATPWRRAR